jgi:porphobilinogen synthase
MEKPIIRPRRLRRTPELRSLVRENTLSISDFVMPMFIVPGSKVKKEISSIPGIFHLSADMAAEEAKELSELGISSTLLFGIPERKDPTGSSAWDEHGPVQMAIRSIKKSAPNLLVATDLCFCEYTSHGHCGAFCDHDVDNDATLDLIAKQTLSHADAGADIIAPSGMMDGCVRTIRTALDENSFKDTVIMSYAVKYASGYYGPFRDAAQSAPEFGDRSTYQMDSANSAEALREAQLDIEEGADIIMVKPALAYLDIIKLIKDTFQVPTAAYSVSGEYSMIKLAGSKGLINGKRVMEESLLGMKRAGADILISYYAKEFALAAR